MALFSSKNNIYIINHNGRREKIMEIKISREREQRLFSISMIVSSLHGLNLGTTKKNVKRKKSWKKGATKTYNGSIYSMWEVLRFPCHEMFESFVNAVQFSDSSHQHRSSTAIPCWHGLEISPCPPILFIPNPPSEVWGYRVGSFRVLLKWFSFSRSTEGVKFVINYRFS